MAAVNLWTLELFEEAFKSCESREDVNELFCDLIDSKHCDRFTGCWLEETAHEYRQLRPRLPEEEHERRWLARLAAGLN